MIAALFAASVSLHAQTAEKAIAEISDPKTTEAVYRMRVLELGSLPSESPEVWKAIITDEKYDRRRRRWAVIKLLERHIRARMPLTELVTLIPANDLFKEEEIYQLGAFSGPAPPRVWSSEATFHLNVLPDAPDLPLLAGYIVLSHDCRPEALLSVLSGKPSPDLKGARLFDLTFYDNYVSQHVFPEGF